MDLLALKRKALGHHACGGGGGGSSSTEQNTTNTDNRRVIGQNGVSAENSNVNYSISTTDDGAVSAGVGLASQSLADMLGLSTTVATNSNALDKAVLAFAGNSQTQAVDSLNTSTAAIQNAYASARGQGNLTEYVLIGAMALCGIIAYVAISKK